MKAGGKSIQDMLAAFINDGGIVIACGACSKAAGLTIDDYIEGVKMGNPELVSGLLFDPSVKIYLGDFANKLFNKTNYSGLISCGARFWEKASLNGLVSIDKLSKDSKGLCLFPP